jgi:quercetin dioxygenase-like cupin family protein
MAKYLSQSQVYKLPDLVSYVEGSTVSRILHKNKAGNITLFAFSQGQSLSKHKASYDAYIQIMEGKSLVTIDDTPYHLEKGDVIILPANIPHAVDAVTDFQMLLVMLKGEKE